MKTKAGKLRRVPENLPPGPRGIEAILAAKLPEEAPRRAPRDSRLWNRTGRRSRRVMVQLGGLSRRQREEGEDHRWRMLELAYLRGDLVDGEEGSAQELARRAGLHYTGDVLTLQMSLAEHRSPLLLIDLGYGRMRVTRR